MKKQMQAQNAAAQNSSASMVKAKGGAARRREVFGKVVVGALVLAVAGGAIWGGIKLFGGNTPEPASLPTDPTAIQMLNTEQSTDASAIPTTEESAAPTEETAAPTEETAAPTEETAAPTEPEPSTEPEATTDVVTVELDSVLARVAEDDQARAELKLAYPDAIIPYFLGGVTEVAEIKQDGDRYLVKLVHAVTVTATEEEIAQARQSGTLVLRGKTYRFTDSGAQAGEWAGFGPRPLEGEGWIMEEGTSTVYQITHNAGQCYFTGILPSWDQWVEEITDTTWVWMDGDMPVNSLIASTLDEFAQINKVGGQSTVLLLNENGKPVIFYSRAG